MQSPYHQQQMALAGSHPLLASQQHLANGSIRHQNPTDIPHSLNLSSHPHPLESISVVPILGNQQKCAFCPYLSSRADDMELHCRNVHLNGLQFNKQLVDVACLIKPPVDHRKHFHSSTTSINGRSSLLTGSYGASAVSGASNFDLRSSSLAELDESTVAAANTILSISASSNSSTASRNRSGDHIPFKNQDDSKASSLIPSNINSPENNLRPKVYNVTTSAINSSNLALNRSSANPMIRNTLSSPLGLNPVLSTVGVSSTNQFPHYQHHQQSAAGISDLDRLAASVLDPQTIAALQSLKHVPAATDWSQALAAEVLLRQQIISVNAAAAVLAADPLVAVATAPNAAVAATFLEMNALQQQLAQTAQHVAAAQQQASQQALLANLAAAAAAVSASSSAQQQQRRSSMISASSVGAANTSNVGGGAYLPLRSDTFSGTLPSGQYLVARNEGAVQQTASEISSSRIIQQSTSQHQVPITYNSDSLTVSVSDTHVDDDLLRPRASATTMSPTKAFQQEQQIQGGFNVSRRHSMLPYVSSYGPRVKRDHSVDTSTIKAPTSSVTRSPVQIALRSPEEIGQHISRIISENEALLEPSPILAKRRTYVRQANQFSSVQLASSAQSSSSSSAGPCSSSPSHVGFHHHQHFQSASVTNNSTLSPPTMLREYRSNSLFSSFSPRNIASMSGLASNVKVSSQLTDAINKGSSPVTSNNAAHSFMAQVESATLSSASKLSTCQFCFLSVRHIDDLRRHEEKCAARLSLVPSPSEKLYVTIIPTDNQCSSGSKSMATNSGISRTVGTCIPLKKRLLAAVQTVENAPAVKRSTPALLDFDLMSESITSDTFDQQATQSSSTQKTFVASSVPSQSFTTSMVPGSVSVVPYTRTLIVQLEKPSMLHASKLCDFGGIPTFCFNSRRLRPTGLIDGKSAYLRCIPCSVCPRESERNLLLMGACVLKMRYGLVKYSQAASKDSTATRLTHSIQYTQRNKLLRGTVTSRNRVETTKRHLPFMVLPPKPLRYNFFVSETASEEGKRVKRCPTPDDSRLKHSNFSAFNKRKPSIHMLRRRSALFTSSRTMAKASNLADEQSDETTSNDGLCVVTDDEDEKPPLGVSVAASELILELRTKLVAFQNLWIDKKTEPRCNTPFAVDFILEDDEFPVENEDYKRSKRSASVPLELEDSYVMNQSLNRTSPAKLDRLASLLNFDDATIDPVNVKQNHTIGFGGSAFKPVLKANSDERRRNSEILESTVHLENGVSPIFTGVVRSTGDDSSELLCSICDKHFPNRTTYVLHMDGHKIEKPRRYEYKCPYCPSSCRSRNNVSKHISMVHPKVRSFNIDMLQRHKMRDETLTTSSASLTTTYSSSSRTPAVPLSEKNSCLSDSVSIDPSSTNSISLTMLGGHSALVNQLPSPRDVVGDQTVGFTAEMMAAEGPRPFKCKYCDNKAFRIHGHLAKHLRSKQHIMCLESAEKVPPGTYSLLENRPELQQIDTTDCENSLESLLKILDDIRSRSTTSSARNRQRQPSSGHSQTQTQQMTNKMVDDCSLNRAVLSPTRDPINKPMSVMSNGPLSDKNLNVKNGLGSVVNIKDSNSTSTDGSPSSLLCTELFSVCTSPPVTVPSRLNSEATTANKNVLNCAANFGIRFPALHDRDNRQLDSSNESTSTIARSSPLASFHVSSSSSLEQTQLTGLFTDTTSPSVSDDAPSSRGGVNKLKCALCKVKFSSNVELEIHYDADHVVMRDGDYFKCPKPHCDTLYVSRRNLREHLMTHHYKNIGSCRRISEQSTTAGPRTTSIDYPTSYNIDEVVNGSSSTFVRLNEHNDQINAIGRRGWSTSTSMACPSVTVSNGSCRRIVTEALNRKLTSSLMTSNGIHHRKASFSTTLNNAQTSVSSANRSSPCDCSQCKSAALFEERRSSSVPDGCVVDSASSSSSSNDTVSPPCCSSAPETNTLVDTNSVVAVPSPSSPVTSTAQLLTRKREITSSTEGLTAKKFKNSDVPTIVRRKTASNRNSDNLQSLSTSTTNGHNFAYFDDVEGLYTPEAPGSLMALLNRAVMSAAVGLAMEEGTLPIDFATIRKRANSSQVTKVCDGRQPSIDRPVKSPQITHDLPVADLSRIDETPDGDLTELRNVSNLDGLRCLICGEQLYSSLALQRHFLNRHVTTQANMHNAAGESSVETTPITTTINTSIS